MSYNDYLSDIELEEQGDDYDGGSSDSGPRDDDEVSVQGAGSQIGQSIKNVFTGIICFFASFAVLWCGATRTELGKEFTAAKAIEQAQEGKMAYVSGTPEVAEVGDGEHVQAGKYIRIEKTKEYYAIVSTKHSETKKEGTKQVTRSYYTYSLEWTSSPRQIEGRDKSRWRDFVRQNNLPNDISNPTAQGEATQTINTSSLTVSGYTVPVNDIRFKGGAKQLEPVYISGKADRPQVGDERFKYTVYPADQKYTFAGSKSGRTLAPTLVDNSPMLLAAPGEIQNLIGNLKSEDRMMWWIWLIVGFVLMSAGLNMMVGPLTTLLDFIPYIGEFGAGLIRFVLTLIAAIISVVFYLAIYYWWVVLLVVAAIVAFIVYRKKSAPAPAK